MILKLIKYKCKSGFSLAELLVAMIISVVLALTVGVISTISLKADKKYRDEIQVHTDAAYGFKLIRKYVRESSDFSIDTSPPGPWVSDRVKLDITGFEETDRAFGLYQNGTNVDFVFLPDETDETNREIILSVPTGNISLNVTNPAANSITLDLQVTKDGYTYNISTTAMRRRG